MKNYYEKLLSMKEREDSCKKAVTCFTKPESASVSERKVPFDDKLDR